MRPRSLVIVFAFILHLFASSACARAPTDIERVFAQAESQNEEASLAVGDITFSIPLEDLTVRGQGLSTSIDLQKENNGDVALEITEGRSFLKTNGLSFIRRLSFDADGSPTHSFVQWSFWHDSGAENRAKNKVHQVNQITAARSEGTLAETDGLKLIKGIDLYRINDPEGRPHRYDKSVFIVPGKPSQFFQQTIVLIEMSSREIDGKMVRFFRADFPVSENVHMQVQFSDRELPLRFAPEVFSKLETIIEGHLHETGAREIEEYLEMNSHKLTVEWQ